VGGSGICWAICKSAPHSRQPRQHPTTQFFTGRMPFLSPNQQHQSTEGISKHWVSRAGVRVTHEVGTMIRLRYILKHIIGQLSKTTSLQVDMSTGCPVSLPKDGVYTSRTWTWCITTITSHWKFSHGQHSLLGTTHQYVQNIWKHGIAVKVLLTYSAKPDRFSLFYYELVGLGLGLRTKWVLWLIRLRYIFRHMTICWWDAGMVMCLQEGADLHMAQLMPLPLTISCSSKSRLVLPSWLYLSGTGSPG